MGSRIMKRNADLAKCDNELLSLCKERLRIIHDIVGLEIDAEVYARYEVDLQQEEAGKQAMAVTLKEQKAYLARMARKILKESEKKLKASLSGNKRRIEEGSESESDDDAPGARKKARSAIARLLLPSPTAAAAAASSPAPPASVAPNTVD